MRFLIATGIYPPEIGGPAYYAKNLCEALKAKGHEAEVVTFGPLKAWPTGLRHLGLFLKTLPLVPGVDAVIALDTFSAAIPAFFASKIFLKPVIVRTGGDFLWEQYVERSGDLLPLPYFYERHQPFSRLERVYFALTKFLLKRVTVVFSTQFQKKIWMPVYGLHEKKVRVIPNAITEKMRSEPHAKKNFLMYGRDVKLRNKQKVRDAFAKAKQRCPDIELEEGQVPQHVLFERIRGGYCLLLPSISDISPNYILDGLRAGKPFIMTKYSEYAETYKDLGLFVDPQDENDIVEKIVRMADEREHAKLSRKIEALSLDRTYAELADDFVALARML